MPTGECANRSHGQHVTVCARADGHMAAYTSTYDVFVTNIPLSAKNVKVGLNGLFSKFGTVERLSVREKDYYQTAFVKFADEEAAKNSIVEVNGKYFQGSKLSVAKGACWGGVSSYPGRRDYGYRQDHHKGEVARSRSSSLKQDMDQQAASFDVGTKRQVVVTHVENCWTFWAQTMDQHNTELVYKITSEVGMYCGKNPVVVSTPDYSEVYAAVYDGDGCWYRCKVLDISNDECLIRYIDFGNSAIVDKSSLRKLPVELQEHKVTEHFVLAGLAKPTDNEKEAKAMELLKASLTDKVILVEVVEHSKIGALSVKAFLTGSDEVDVGEKMVRDGLAEYLSETARPHTPNSPHSEPSEDEDDSATEAAIPVVGGKLEQLQSFIKWTPSKVDAPNPSPVKQTSITSPTLAKQLSVPTSEHSPVSHSEKIWPPHTPYVPKSPRDFAGNTEMEQQKEMGALRAELERKRVEVHQLRMSNVGLENDKKYLAKECDGLKQNLHQVHLEVEMLQTRLSAVQNTDEKLASCWSQLVKTHQLRATAMASGSSWLVDLVHVTSTLRKEERVSLENMAVVEELKNTLQKFEEAQHSIRICLEKGEVAQLVDARNEAREKLLQAIESFTAQAKEKLGDGSRMKLLKQCSDVLTACGIESKDLHVLEEGEMENLLMRLQELQGERSHEVKQLLAATDRQVETCCDALDSLKKMLSSPTCAEGDMGSFPDINVLLDLITKACTAELLVLGRDDNASVPEDICEILSQLMGSIQLEVKEIQMLNQLKDQYASLRVVVEESLNLNAHVDQLQDAKRTVRDLRRQHGHRLVDQKEFSQDPLNESVEELQQVDAELKDIRASLHKAFAEEQKQSIVLSKYLEYLPEIEQLHPELGLQQCRDSDGLMVPGRDLEHFEVTEVVTGTDIPLYFSHFLDQHCVLKEYSLDSGGSLDRILENAKSLNRVACDSVVKVINISPNVGKKKLLVQLEGYLEHDLQSFLQQPRDPQVVKAILKKVLEGIHCFHRLDLVYGSLTARSVRVQFSQSFDIGDDVNVQIVDFDLGKSVEDRCQAAGIPECTYREATPRMADDMYLFGKMLLLAFCGQSDVQHDKSGKPSIAALTADSLLCSLLDGLLHSDPRLRISASSALLHSFF